MSINTVTILNDNLLFQLDISEHIISSYPKVQLALVSGGGYPGLGGTYNCRSGTLTLTNKRVVYCKEPPVVDFKSFQVALTSIKNITTSTSYWSGSEFKAQIIPVPSQGLHGGMAEVSFTFPDKSQAGEFKAFHIHALQEEIRIRSGEGESVPLPSYSVNAGTDVTVLSSPADRSETIDAPAYTE